MTINSSKSESKGDNQWLVLKEIIAQKSLSSGKAVKLASGRESNFYFNMKMTMSQPEALKYLAGLFLEKIEHIGGCDYVGGLEMGAIPLLNAVCMQSYELQKPVPLFWVRKQAKEHGTQSLIEGQEISDLKDKTAIILEDVTTSGGSSLKAVEISRNAGMKISDIITIVDRQEGASENLQAHDVMLHALYRASDFK